MRTGALSNCALQCCRTTVGRTAPSWLRKREIVRAAGVSNLFARPVRLLSALPPPGGVPVQTWAEQLLPIASMGAKGVALVVALPYCGVLLALVTFQRSLIFPRPSHKAVVGAGGLVQLAGTTDASPSVALHVKPAVSTAPTVVYFHGNADQIGWVRKPCLPSVCSLWAAQAVVISHWLACRC
jgi:hypothetical protein